MIASQAAGSQPATNDRDLPAQHREVQRLLGRCLLRLQQYERLMKAIVAYHNLSGPAHALEKRSARRASMMLPPKRLAPWGGSCPDRAS
jgi:hypothetical protein